MTRIGGVQASTRRPLPPDLKPPRALVFKALDAQTAIEQLAGKLEGNLARAILEAFTAQQASVDIDALVLALQSGNVAQVLALLDLDASLAAFGPVPTAVQAGAYAAGAAVASEIALQLRGATFVFNQLNPRLIQWLQTYNLGLIRQINEQTKEGIRQYLVSGMTAGKNPKQVAVEVKNIVGLTQKQAAAVGNFRRQLEMFHMKRTAGAWNLGAKIDRVNGTQVLRPDEDGTPKDGIDQRRLRDFRFDGQLKRAMESGKPLTPQQIDKMVAAYSRKYLAYRSRTIARTEAIRTNNVGIAEAWQQAIESGKVEERLVRKQWIVARDERLCEVCGPIPRMNPKRGVAHNRPFATPNGPQLLPPMHPNCRCTVFYRQWEPKQLVGENP